MLKARSVSHAHQLPIIPVHHMEAHALVRFGTPSPSRAKMLNPFPSPLLLPPWEESACLTLCSGSRSTLLLPRL